MRGLPAPAVFRVPKYGSTRAEYEDAMAWSRRQRRFAVADGASASAFARLWARLLVQAYVAGGLRAANLEHDLAPLQARWLADVEQRDLPWYAAEQARRGAFAALVGAGSRRLLRLSRPRPATVGSGAIEPAGRVRCPPAAARQQSRGQCRVTGSRCDRQRRRHLAAWRHIPVDVGRARGDVSARSEHHGWPDRRPGLRA